MDKIILASGSPRRRALLQNYGLDIEISVPEFDESSVNEKQPQNLVIELARGKNRCIKSDKIVISADTVVTLDGKILGKPKDKNDARKMLRLLSSKTHTVFTGVCISKGDREFCFYEHTDVTFYKLSDKQIELYINTDSPYDKAGGYGIQDDMGIGFVKEVSGELSNVIGLPMASVITVIDKLQGENDEKTKF